MKTDETPLGSFLGHPVEIKSHAFWSHVTATHKANADDRLCPRYTPQDENLLAFIVDQNLVKIGAVVSPVALFSRRLKIRTTHNENKSYGTMRYVRSGKNTQ